MVSGGDDRLILKSIRYPLPKLRQAQFYRYPSVQPDVQDIPGCYRGCKEYGIFKTGDGTGNFCKLQERTENHPERRFPFGIGQIGKSFRNEITPGNFTFRTREFEQMELEFFCEPGTDLDWFQYWRSFCINWLKISWHEGR